MKTIKFISLIGIIIFTFWSCNPNKDLYEMLDQAEGPYNESFSYTLTDEDYSTIKDLALANAQTTEDSSKANAIATYKSFAVDRPAQDYIPLFLGNKFLALDSSSAIEVFYNFDSLYIYPSDNVLTQFSDTLGEGGDFTIFYPLLEETFDNPQEGDMALVKYADTTGTLHIGLAPFVYRNNSWHYEDNTYVLSDDDYVSMGNPGPGKYKNFSADYPPENYLPTFLKLKYPYAKEGDYKNLVYKYYRSGKGSLEYHHTAYFFTNGVWQDKEVKSDKFIHNGEEWLYDPTIRFTMTCDDYQIIVDWIKNNDTLSGYMDPQYDNTEYYFGASSYYCNFDMRVYKRRDNDPNHYLDNLSDDEALQVLFDRLQLALEILLETKYPDAQPIVQGVQLYAVVTFQTYEPGRYQYSMTFKCVSQGKFEYVEDSLTKLE